MLDLQWIWAFLGIGVFQNLWMGEVFHDGICILCFQQVSYVAPLDPYWEHQILSSATNSNRFPTDEIKKSIVTPKKMQKRLDLPRFQWKFILFCIVLVVPQNWSQNLHQAPKGSRKAAVPWQCRQGFKIGTPDLIPRIIYRKYPPKWTKIPGISRVLPRRCFFFATMGVNLPMWNNWLISPKFNSPTIKWTWWDQVSIYRAMNMGILWKCFSQVQQFHGGWSIKKGTWMDLQQAKE